MNLKYQSLIGVFWTFLGTVGGGIVSFVLTMLLARLLSPSDYGLLELLMVFTILSAVFVDCGFSQAIIKDKNASNTDLSSVFYFNLAISITIYIVLFLSSPLIADFFSDKRLLQLSRFVFLVVIFDSMTIIQNANYAKNMQFRPQSIATILAMSFAGIVAVVLAFKGFGVWALAVNMVLYSFFKMLFYWVQSKWFPSFEFSIKSIKKYFSFGVNLLLQGLLDKFVSNLESIMIGRYYTKSELGNFSQSRKLDSYIAQTTTSVIQKVSYPALSQLNTDDSLKSGYRKILSITMFFMIPLMSFCVFFADNVIIAFFGNNWVNAVPYFRLWCLCGLLVSFYQIFINLFLIKNKTRQLLKVSIFRQVIRVVAIFLLIKLSVLHLLVGITLVTLMSCIIYVYVGGRLINYSLKEVFSDIWFTIVVTFLSLLTTFVLTYNLENLGTVCQLLIQSAITVSLYVCFMFFSKNRTFNYILNLVKSLKNKESER